MKAVVFKKYGPIDVLQLGERPLPVPLKNEVLIKVHSASLNPVDWKVRMGKLKIIMSRKFPKGIGADFSGEVVSVGPDVNKFKKGDLVFGGVSQTSSTEGSLAEYVKVPQNRLTFKPTGVSHNEAASLPIAARSALQGLRDLGGIKPGYRVLINGAAGGVGSFAVQIAKHFRAEVTATCSAKNIPLVKELGADIIFDYTLQDVRRLKGPFDIFFDVVPTTHLSEVRKNLTPQGVYVTTLPTFPDIVAQLYSFFTRRKSKILIMKSSLEDLDTLAREVAEKKLKVIVGVTAPLEKFRECYLASESGHGHGKIIIEVQPS